MRSSTAGSTAAKAALLALAVAGCGGGRSETCDDAAFRAQDEELYVAIVTAHNAGSSANAALARDLRRAAAALERILAKPPCSDELALLAEREREAASSLRRAADDLESGRDPTSAAVAARRALTEVEQRLFAPGR